jgi:hypothetical protein
VVVGSDLGVSVGGLQTLANVDGRLFALLQQETTMQECLIV